MAPPHKPSNRVPALELKTCFEGTLKALVLTTLGTVLVLWAATITVDNLEENTEANRQLFAQFTVSSKPVMWLLIIHLLFIVVLRYGTDGTYNIYEMIWGCNAAQFLAVYGMWSARPLMVGAACAIVAVDQMMWWVDAIGYVLTGKFLVGVSKYLSWPQTRWTKKVTATHHLWFMPVCLYALSGFGGVRAGSLLVSCLLTTILCIWARLFTPYAVLVPSVKQGGEAFYRYLNINLGFEFWPDIHAKFLHAFDNSPAWIYVPYVVLVSNLVLNTIPNAILRASSIYFDL